MSMRGTESTTVNNQPETSRHITDHGSKSSAAYRPELDALRFFAFLCVFCFHRMDYVGTDPIRDRWGFRIGTIGAFGVPVFFLLSAFLITDLLLRERERTGRVHIQAFYIRRILRIWPLYFAAFFGLSVLNRFVPAVSTNDPFAWLAFTFFGCRASGDHEVADRVRADLVQFVHDSQHRLDVGKSDTQVEPFRDLAVVDLDPERTDR